MFESYPRSSKFAANPIESTRTRSAVSLLALGAAVDLILLLVMGFTLAAPASAQGRLNVQQLGDALTSYGKNTVNNNGHTYYTVMCGHGQWKSSVSISLSPNGNVIWMAIEPIQLPSRTSPAALESLLKKNVELGPMFFSLDGNWLRLSYPVPNNDMSETKVKAYLEAVVNTAVDTEPLWDPKTLGGN